MKRDLEDFHFVDDRHLDIHARLVNWSRYVQVRPGSFVGPIWKLGKSNGRQWSEPTMSIPVNTLDGHKIERAVAMLPEKHREAVRWAYCRRSVLPHKVRKQLGVTDAGLMELIRSGRAMLINRGV